MGGFKQIIQEILNYHQGKALGVLFGLVFGWFAISYGFFKALFVALCIVIGYLLGKRADDNADIKNIFDRLFRGR